uniref:zinc finger protein OZF-like n=1 Tax=Doryrhamphus excisus TaxID=161450 RepID=UPI0025AE0D8E|nr:zinc finger protein OZF-like [Doryrhamphus excisus]
MLKELVKERLMVAADEILELFERMIRSYEEELCRTREEKDRYRQQLEAVCKTQTVLHIENLQNLGHHQEYEWSSNLKQEDPQPPHIKEEEDEELWTTQEEECLFGLEETHLTRLPLTVVRVETACHEDNSTESSQLHHRPDRGSRSDNDTSSHSADAKTEDDTQEPLSSDADPECDMRTQTDFKHSKKPFSCSVCGKRFSEKSHIITHMRTHTGEKPFSCSVCPQRFSQMSHVLSHMRTHTGKKPFGCYVCGRRFSEKSNMVSHLRTHTGEKPFRCSVCDKTFSQRVHMIKHMRTHTGEKPYICSVCDKRFTQNSTMVKHMRTHTGEKPYICSICQKRFTQKVTMVKHMRTHTGEKPYICSICDKRFCQNVTMVKHMRTHTGE